MNAMEQIVLKTFKAYLQERHPDLPNMTSSFYNHVVDAFCAGEIRLIANGQPVSMPELYRLGEEYMEQQKTAPAYREKIKGLHRQRSLPMLG